MDSTAFATFTGKASLVLQNKGLPATTIHKLIYNIKRNTLYRVYLGGTKLKKTYSCKIIKR